MTSHFHFRRTLEASACLLRLDGDRMDQMRLLKLLYIAEREWLGEAAESLTGDRVVAMERGPVLSEVFDLIKRVSHRHSAVWDEHIAREGYLVVLRRTPGTGSLSRGILRKLAEVTERCRSLDHWELSELTHGFAEWKECYTGPRPPATIPREAILKAVGQPDLAAEVEENETLSQALDELFGEVGT